jgi:hypothetical protein
VDCVSNVSLDCENAGPVTNCERRGRDERICRAPWRPTTIRGFVRVFLPTGGVALAKSGCKPTSWGEGHTRQQGTYGAFLA